MNNSLFYSLTAGFLAGFILISCSPRATSDTYGVIHVGVTDVGVMTTGERDVLRWEGEADGDEYINAMREDGLLAYVVRSLVSSGEVCKVIGHRWESHGHVTVGFDSDRGDCRQCGLCGLHQERKLSDWE